MLPARFLAVHITSDVFQDTYVRLIVDIRNPESRKCRHGASSLGS